ncbi:MAG: hypothetical protein DWI10_03075 [Planctomycetota bacterium]|nr:MAG: hypothetical protein DWI10_03075 [Planctomycetota bacterium]
MYWPVSSQRTKVQVWPTEIAKLGVRSHSGAWVLGVNLYAATGVVSPFAAESIALSSDRATARLGRTRVLNLEFFIDLFSQWHSEQCGAVLWPVGFYPP